MLQDIIAGAAGGIAANIVGNRVEDVVDPEEDSPTVDHIKKLHDHQQKMHQWQQEYEDAIVTWRPTPQDWELREYGYCHLSALFPTTNNQGTNVTTIQLRIFLPGLGTLIKNVTAGWVQLDLPPGAQISTNDSNSYNVLLRFHNFSGAYGSWL